jgi:Mn-dependent DtxR family transcriptional regulator
MASVSGIRRMSGVLRRSLSRRIGVTPSVVVDMLNELEALGAIRRVPQRTVQRGEQRPAARPG